ncbi:MAG: hypothetical protein H6706_27805 [Myxococcales bacterium]|nr:hypothetical protein [Myxococcales bacterium]
MTDRATALETAEACLAAADPEGAFAALRPHVEGIRDDERVALLWARLLSHVTDEEALAGEIKRFARAWPDHPAIALALAEAAAAAGRRLPFDSPRAPDGLFALGVQVLGRAVNDLGEKAFEDEDFCFALHLGLARVCAEAGPAFANDADAAFRLALEARPDAGHAWLERARFLLRRRDWYGAAASAQEAARRLTPDGPAWFLAAAAATGRRDGAAARDAWIRAGLDPAVGPDGLPLIAGLAPVEVRLSAATPGPRTPATGAQPEWVRVQPYSPCHGRIEHPTARDLAGDFADVVLFEGTPLGFRTVDGQEVPRFVAVAVLEAGAARTLRYATADAPPGELAPGVFLHPLGERHGKLVAPAHLPDADLRALVASAAPGLAVPALFADTPAGAAHRRRFAHLLSPVEFP